MSTIQTEPERIRSALQCIPATNRELWLIILMAIKNEFGDAGREIAENWSQTEPAFNVQAFQDVWRSIKPGGGVSVGSLFHHAREHGWRDDQPHVKPTAEQVEQRQREAANRADTEQAKRQRRHAKAAKTAAAIWEKAKPAQADHPYLERKGVQPSLMLRELPASELAQLAGYAPHAKGQTLTGRVLIARIKVSDKLSSLELIDEKGIKTALAGGQKSGGYAPLQPMPKTDGEGLTILIGEGIATCISAKMAMDCPAFAALSSGNLLAVASELRRNFPKADFVILAELLK